MLIWGSDPKAQALFPPFPAHPVWQPLSSPPHPPQPLARCKGSVPPQGAGAQPVLFSAPAGASALLSLHPTQPLPCTLVSSNI